jgi:hypothetical protein
MAAESSNWATRLVIKYMPNGGASEIITPITNLQPAADLPKEIIDSIDACNTGVSFGNPRYSFTFEVRAINKGVFRKIFATALKGTKFSVGIATGSGLPDDWVFDSIEMRDCYITNVDPSNIENTGHAPSMKFTAICLDWVVGNNGEVITTNHVGGASGNLN